MSNWREQFEDESGAEVVSAWLSRYYHVLVLAFLVGFAFWNRARYWGRFIFDGEVLFSSNDPWYHYRMVQYTVHHFPATMPYDVWTRFPIGTAQSQFGTIFDQIMATIALVVGLGNPSNEMVRHVVLFAPALFGAAILIPAYFIGKHFGGRFSGLIAAGVIALAPDALLARSLVGFSDHQVAEALFQGFAVLGIVVALAVARKEKPVYEQLLARDYEGLRRPLGWGVIAGIGIGAYLWVWPPGVLLLGILGVFFLVHLCVLAVKGRSPEHSALVGALALVTAGLMQLSTVNVIDISATSRTLLQPGLAFFVAFGCLFMAWLFREWDARNLSKWSYPVAVAGILAVVTVVTAVVLPDIFDYFVTQVLRVVGFQTSPTAGTVGEAQPLRDPGALVDWYKLAFFTAVAGVCIVIVKQVMDDEPSAGELLVVVWFLFIVAATFTQSRFAYYLALPVASLTAVVSGVVMQFVGEKDNALALEPYEVLVVFAVLMATVAPLAWGMPAMTASKQGASPGLGIIGWNDGLEWVSDHTPAEGKLANPNGEAMEYLGTYKKTDDYDYPAGSYGVLSWWDYGHWITTQGERIPNANPFQQGTTAAAEFLTAQNESAANDVLAQVDEDDAKTRYVMVDWKMAETETGVNGKFFAPVRFADNVTRKDFYARVGAFSQNGGFSTRTIWHKQDYYNSTAARLYLYHGSAMEPIPVVTDWRGQQQYLGNGDWFVRPPSDGRVVKFFGNNMSAARQYVQNDTTSQLGGIGPYPAERVPAMEHYRLVHMSRYSALQGGLRSVVQRDVRSSGLLQEFMDLGYNRSQAAQRATAFLYRTSPQWVKTFEKVPGGTIEGSGPANATITLRAQMVPENGAPFTYTQQVTTGADGEFTATVPYSTTGYDAVGPKDGYGNTSVRATGPYQVYSSPILTNNTITRFSGTVNVTEKQVLGVNDTASSVKLTKPEPQNGTDGNGTDGGNATDGSGSTGGNATDGTGGNATDGGSTNGTSGSNTTNSLDGVGVVSDARRVTP